MFASNIVLLIQPIGNIYPLAEANSIFLQRQTQSGTPTDPLESDPQATPPVKFDKIGWQITLHHIPKHGRAWVFGRSYDCDFRLAEYKDLESGVSRKHSMIYHHPDSKVLMLENLSGKGTEISIYQQSEIIHGKRIMERETVIRAGMIRLLVTVPNHQDDILEYLHNVTAFLEDEGSRTPIAQVSDSKGAETLDIIPLYDELELRGEIGQGSYGRINFALHRRTGNAYAVKTISKNFKGHDETRRRKKIKAEQAVVGRMQHPNIVTFYQGFETAINLILVMELAQQGNLCHEYGILTADETMEVALQQCSAVEYLHDINITHRDIKPNNILVSSRSPLITKLADFGECSLQPYMSTNAGGDHWKAPEMKELNDNESTTNKVDIWSLGMVLVYLLEPKEPVSALRKVPSRFVGTLAQLCCRMLHLEVEQRSSAAECMALLKQNPTATWMPRGNVAQELIPELKIRTLRNRIIHIQ